MSAGPDKSGLDADTSARVDSRETATKAMLANNTRDIESPRNDEPTTNQPDAVVTDGGVAWTDLTAFQRDLLVTIAQLKERPNGTEIKNEVSHLRGEEINHGRLYPNLNKLTDRSLLQKGQLDARTNYYQLTSIAVELLIEGADLLDHSASCAMAEETPIVTDGGRDRLGVTSVDVDPERYVTERVYECSDRSCQAVSGYTLNGLCPVCYGAEWVMVVRRALL